MPRAFFHLATPLPAGDAAIAAVEVVGDIDGALAALSIAPVKVGVAAVRDLCGVDTGVVARWGQGHATLMPHAGPAVVAGVLRACVKGGLIPTPGTPGGETIDECLHAALVRAGSPLAIDVLLDQPRRWRTRGADDALAPGLVLGHLIRPPLVVMLGPPNVGKSSLLNALASGHVALVADGPGTTRDPVGVPLIVDGLAIRWLDTPGLSEAPACRLDAMAQRAARDVIARADLLLIAHTLGVEPIEHQCRAGQRALHVGLRGDLGQPGRGVDVLTSVRTGAGLVELAGAVRRALVPDGALAHPGAWVFWPEGQANNAGVAGPKRTLRKADRITRGRDYERAYAGRTSVARGPLRIHAVPSATGKTRLGLSISKGGGTSVQRNAIKRLIREAFRLCRGELPAGHDLIVSARPHEPMGLQAYQHALQTAAKQLADTWNARASKGRPG